MLRPISLGKVHGIPMEVRPSAFILLGLLVIVMAFGEGMVFGLPIGFGGLEVPAYVKLALGIIGAEVLFFGILLHEIAHGIMARRIGHAVHVISVQLFGGEAKIQGERPHEYIKGEEMIAFVGPAANLGLGGIFLLLSICLGPASTDQATEIAITAFSVLGFYNLLLGFFNLLPGYPFDGGLILRSLLRRRMDHDRTTLTAIKVCRLTAIGLGVFGFLWSDVAVVLIAILLYLTAYLEDPEYSFKIE
ncbi:MAG: Zinc metalloprotease [Methanomassiliicoccales archaeon PtaU1.Bin124]|nr:MAG: Zinc metalloprotease [Methanomassiliicoccales archaeon PtaU1.Bin124]